MWRSRTLKRSRANNWGRLCFPLIQAAKPWKRDLLGLRSSICQRPDPEGSGFLKISLFVSLIRSCPNLDKRATYYQRKNNSQEINAEINEQWPNTRFYSREWTQPKDIGSYNRSMAGSSKSHNLRLPSSFFYPSTYNVLHTWILNQQYFKMYWFRYIFR